MRAIRTDLATGYRVLTIEDERLTKPLNLRPGDLIWAKVVGVSGEGISLELAGQTLPGKIQQNVVVKPGQMIALKVVKSDEGQIELKYFPDKNVPSDDIKSTFTKLGLSDSKENRTILQFMVKHELEISEPKVAQVRELVAGIAQKEKPTTEMIQASVLAVKLGLASSKVATEAIFTYLSQGKDILTILDKIALPEAKDQYPNHIRAEITQHIKHIISSFNIDNNPTSLIKLVQTLLTTPEKVIASIHQELFGQIKQENLVVDKEVKLSNREITTQASTQAPMPASSTTWTTEPLENKITDRFLQLIQNNNNFAAESTVMGLEKLISILNNLEKKQEIKELIQQLTTVKQIVTGNILLAELDSNHISIFIPFFYKQQHCNIRFFKKKNNLNKEKNQSMLNIVVSHRKLGKIKFNLTAIDRTIEGDILVTTQEVKELIESRLNQLIDKVSQLQFKLLINRVIVEKNTKTQETGHEDIANLELAALGINRIDIKV